MIAANELRIGNWVLWNGPDHVENAKISAISNEEVAFKCGDYGLINEIQPIPLTTEILEKCGFVMLHHLGKIQPTFKIDSSFELHWSAGILYATFSQDNYDENIDLSEFIIERALPNIKYFHQLQNYLYFQTGEELNYTP